MQADIIKRISKSIGSFWLVLFLFIDVNDSIRCGIYTCDSQIASVKVAFKIVIYILKNPTLRRPRLHLCILFQIYDSDYSQSDSNPSLFLAFPIQHVLLTLVADQETLVGAIETIGIVSVWVFRPSPLTISTCSFFGTCTPSGDERKFDGVGDLMKKF